MFTKIKFIAVADLHLGCKLYNIPELKEDLNDVFEIICNTAINLGVDYLVIVGDLFDHNKPTPDIISFVKTQVSRLNKKGIEVVGISGDHDKSLNGETWVSVSGIKQLDHVPYFAGCNYCDNSFLAFDYFRQKKESEKVEWLFAHGQEESMFQFISDRKRLQFTKFPVTEYFPNCKGIILGDIHNPIEGKIVSNERDIYIGYCGSPGYVKLDEIGQKKGILYYDGETLSRLPIFPKREYKKINVTKDTGHPGLLINSIITDLQLNPKELKPFFIFEVEMDLLAEVKTYLSPLYDLALVRIIKIRTENSSPDNQKDTGIIRDIIDNKNKYHEVLKTCELDSDLVDLTLDLLMEETDPKEILDKFKKEQLENND